MTIKGTIYEDRQGRLYFVRCETLPKVRGQYKFWFGEPVELDLNVRGKSARGATKAEVLNQLNEKT